VGAPTIDAVLTVARAKIGLTETPPDSKHNLVTEWYGMDGPWCAMFVSWVLAHAGFSKDGGATLYVPGVVETTAHGWAYVPYLLNNFRDAGRIITDPQPGAVVVYFWDADTVPDHTGIVEAVLPDGSFQAIEGNHHGVVDRVTRSRAIVEAFCSLPYDGSPPASPAPLPPASGIPPFPGYCSLGSIDKATRLVQQRLADRGWTIAVDGVFGTPTARIVKSFQSEKGLTTDGIVGPATWAALWSP
jgi:hypothetical protein